MELSSPLAKEWTPLLQHILEIKHGILPEVPEINNDIEPRKLRQQQHRLSEGDIQELITAYNSGKTVYELAAQFGCHRNTISRHLKANCVAMRMRPLTDEQIDEAISLYESGLSCAKVGTIVGADVNTIRSRLMERGIRIRDSHGRSLVTPLLDNPALLDKSTTTNV